MASTAVTIYIIQLEFGKYYVGKTEHLEKRLQDHFNGVGCAWTKKYRMLGFVDSFAGDKYDEDKTTVKYMELFGINNVRGGIYSSVTLPLDQCLVVQKVIYNANNGCLACGGTNHFISACRTNICMRCHRPGHTYRECQESAHLYGLSLINCFNCGSPDHMAPNCKNIRDVFGRFLKKQGITEWEIIDN